MISAMPLFDWFKNSRHTLNQSGTTTWNLVTCVFPRMTTVTCTWTEFWLVRLGILWFVIDRSYIFVTIHWKTVCVRRSNTVNSFLQHFSTFNATLMLREKCYETATHYYRSLTFKVHPWRNSWRLLAVLRQNSSFVQTPRLVSVDSVPAFLQ